MTFRSQLGSLIHMEDSRGAWNIVQYAYSRFKRVPRSVLADFIHAVVLVYDEVYFLRETLEETLDRQNAMEAYADSRSVYYVIAKDGYS